MGNTKQRSSRQYCNKCLKALQIKQLAKPNKKSNTIPEKVVRYVLYKAGVYYQPHVSITFESGRYAVVDVLVDDKIVIEVYGDFVHANPKKYPDDYVLRPNHNPDYTAKDRRIQDATVRAQLKRAGYKVNVVWHSDLKNNTKAEVKRILDGCGVAVPDALGGYDKLAAEAKVDLEKREAKRAREWSRRTRDRRNKRNRERYANDLEYRKKVNARNRLLGAQHRVEWNARNRERYANDLNYREKVKSENRASHARHAVKVNTQRRERYNNDLDYKAKINKSNNDKYRNDPDFRDKAKVRSRKRLIEKGDEIKSKQRERYAQDDTYRNMVNTRNRGAYQKRMLRISTRLTEMLGSTCNKCGKATSDMKILTNFEACKSAGHVRLRNSYMQWYVDNPAEAIKFLQLVCPECGRATQSEASRRYMTGKKLTAATKAKIQIGVKKSMTPEVRAKMSAAQKGRTHTDTTKAKMSASKKGSRLTAETRAKISASNKGRRLTDETRAKISRGIKKIMTPEHRARLSAAHKRRAIGATI